MTVLIPYVPEYDNYSKLHTWLYDKHDAFDFPHLSSNIPSLPPYGVYIPHFLTREPAQIMMIF